MTAHTTESVTVDPFALSIFKYDVAQKDLEGYYHTRWDQSVPVSVVAETEADALKKVWAIKGECRRGWTWTARLQSVEPYRRDEGNGHE